jgi:RNA polymerase sigma factor (sigma-70 family)
MDRLIEQLRRAVQAGDGPADRELLERFLARRDEAAFEALLRRHGPMVFGVCRRVLGNAADADDAFQAAWLVFARKAASLRRPGRLAAWLYGVAYRAALEARRADARRRARERRAARPEVVRPDPGDELRELLDAELSRLPENYRAAVVLCELEGLGYREAARRLGWPEGTLAGRLSRARALLAGRLARRGVALPAGALALAGSAKATALPAALAASTVRAATQAAEAGAVSAAVNLLTQGVLRAMWLTKVKITALAVLAVAAAGVGVGILALPAAADAPTATQAGPGKGVPAPAARPAEGGKKHGPQNRLTRAVEDKLREAVQLDCEAVEVRELLNLLRDRYGLNVVIDGPSFQAAGEDQPLGRPVSIRLKGVSLATALRLALHGAGMGYHVEDGVVVVTAGVDGRAKLVRRVYPVSDLVPPGKKADNLIEVITKTVEPASWNALGGQGSIAYFAEGQSLVISQDTSVQDQVRQLLEDLRAARPQNRTK